MKLVATLLTMVEQRLPASISIPLLDISSYLEVPPVATYAAVCLWNFKRSEERRVGKECR